VRYYLNGLFVKIDLNKITVVATDGHRLAINSSDIDQKDSEQKEAIEFILPRKAVIEIEKNCGLSDDPLLLHFYQQHLKIEIGSIQIVTKLIDGKYPDYNKVIPEQLQNKIEVNRLELLSGLQKVSILTAEKHRGIKLHVIGDKILLNSSNAEQEEAEEQILCSKSNLDIKMGFNVSYLIEVLSNIKSDSVELLLSDPQSSALILNSNYKNFKYVVMPMRI
jgi:DNA polymerase-3 subunit beta